MEPYVGNMWKYAETCKRYKYDDMWKYVDVCWSYAEICGRYGGINGKYAETCHTWKNVRAVGLNLIYSAIAQCCGGHKCTSQVRYGTIRR